MARPAGSSILDQNNAELARGLAADAREYEAGFPFEFGSTLSDGDVAVDHRPEHGDGEEKEYQRESIEREHRSGRTHTVLAEHFGDVRVVNVDDIWPGTVYFCAETGVKFVTGPEDPPRTCPACGADGSRDDVDECPDAHASEDAQDGHGDGQDDAADGTDARDDEPTQATLSVFGGGE